MVVQSLHKTLPSPTQTAIIHMKGKYLREEGREGIKRYLSIFQSSSPSYVFMAAIERCIRYMDGEGRERLGEFSRELDDFYGECGGLNNILVLGKGYEGKAGIYARDYSKFILHMGCGRRDGVWLGKYLREHCHLELEMCMPWYALALTSLWDSQEGLKRLCTGLYEADRDIDRMKEKKEEERRILDGLGKRRRWKRNCAGQRNVRGGFRQILFTYTRRGSHTWFWGRFCLRRSFPWWMFFGKAGLWFRG